MDAKTLKVVRSLKARVVRGVKQLDRKEADWEKPGRINIKRLRMESGSSCMLGQLDSPDIYGMGAFEHQRNEYGWSEPQVKQMGFLLYTDEDYHATYSRLTDLWRNVLRFRRGLRQRGPRPFQFRPQDVTRRARPPR